VRELRFIRIGLIPSFNLFWTEGILVGTNFPLFLLRMVLVSVASLRREVLQGLEILMEVPAT
jgi:hypothetical protein